MIPSTLLAYAHYTLLNAGGNGNGIRLSLNRSACIGPAYLGGRALELRDVCDKDPVYVARR